MTSAVLSEALAPYLFGALPGKRCVQFNAGAFALNFEAAISTMRPSPLPRSNIFSPGFSPLIASIF